METAPAFLGSDRPFNGRIALPPGTPMAFELTVEIRSMPKSLIDSWHRTEPPGRRSGHALVAWLGAVSTLRNACRYATATRQVDWTP